MSLVRENENTKGSTTAWCPCRMCLSLALLGAGRAPPLWSSRRVDTLPTSLSSCPAASWSSQLQAVFCILVLNSHLLLQPLGTKFYCILLTEKFKETLKL